MRIHYDFVKNKITLKKSKKADFLLNAETEIF